MPYTFQLTRMQLHLETFSRSAWSALSSFVFGCRGETTGSVGRPCRSPLARATVSMLQLNVLRVTILSFQDVKGQRSSPMILPSQRPSFQMNFPSQYLHFQIWHMASPSSVFGLFPAVQCREKRKEGRRCMQYGSTYVSIRDYL